MSLPPKRLALLTLILLGPLLSPVQAMQSPWWENYDFKERYICPDHGSLVLERNESQASLISGRSSSILFRESSDTPGLIYRNDSLRLVLRGDELTLEQLPQRLICLRTEEA